VFPTRYPSLRFIAYAAIGHWSSGCHNTSHTLIIMNTSIKKNIATSIPHVHIHNKPLTKTLHYVVNITNHTSIGEYRLRFFPRKDFNCLCGLYPIESWRHILYEYRRFNECWNLRRDSISHFISFLEFNSNAFAFANPIT